MITNSGYIVQKRKRKGAYLECKTCGNPFYVFQCRLKLGSVKYCSMRCYPKDGDYNPFWGKRHSEKSIAKMIANPNRPKFGFGEDNPNFIRFGGIYTGLTRRQKREKKAGRPIPKACEICEVERDLHFDHDHITGKFRGWICINCNTALGSIKDNIRILERMIGYIKNAKTLS